MLTGTEGTAEIRFATGEVTVATHREPPHRLPLGAPQAGADDFFDSVLDEVDAAITTEQALRATRVALTAQAHANDGRWHRCP
jgi:predicted dehydrogenase